MAIVIVGVHELKDAVDRPRPAGGLVARLGLLLPQRPRRLLDLLRLAGGDDRDAPAGRGWRAGALVVAAGIALTALIGLSRVYLGVHYMSDVNAGWALGAAAFSLCAAVALVVTTMRSMRRPRRSSDGTVRQNGARAAAGPAEDRK